MRIKHVLRQLLLRLLKQQLLQVIHYTKTKVRNHSVAALMTSCGWWENYVCTQSSVGFVRAMGRVKEDLKLDSWLKIGHRLLTIDNEDVFCDPSVLHDILNSKTIFDLIAPGDVKKKRNLDESAGEESDDGDEEGRERDYISDSSDSDSDLEAKANKEIKSVAEEDALRRLLTSDEDSDEEKKEDDSDKEEDEAKNRKDAKDAKEAKEARDKKRKKLKKKAKDEKKDSSSELSYDSSDSEVDVKKKKPNDSSNNNSRSASPVDNKRKSMPTDLSVSEKNGRLLIKTSNKRFKC